MGAAAADAVSSPQGVSGASHSCNGADREAGEKHPQGGARGVAGNQYNDFCFKSAARECYTRLCARFPEFTVGGDSNVLIIGRKVEGKGGLYIMNGKKILFGAAYDGLLLFLMRGAY